MFLLLSVLLAVLAVVSASSNSISGLILGDWGGMPIPPFHTPAQAQAAAGMNIVAPQIDSKLVLALGDNFYFDGVKNATDFRFKTTFDDVYSGDNLKTLPWHVIAGNHDHHGSIDAQITYSKLNRRWNFPASYHSSKWHSTDNSVTVDIIMLDTVDLSGSSPYTSVDHPNYFDPLPLKLKADAQAQWTWLEQQLAASTATYTIVAGHFSVYSVCDHGSDSTLLTYLKPLLEQYDAHYLSGHDHCMEHLQVPGSKVNYIVSGMGDNCCYRASHKKDVPTDSAKWYYSLEQMVQDKRAVVSGFTSFTASASELTFSFYDQNGNTLYTTPAIAPRAKQ